VIKAKDKAGKEFEVTMNLATSTTCKDKAGKIFTVNVPDADVVILEYSV
jgi:tRNA U55 pseudouridine synthase TruB